MGGTGPPLMRRARQFCGGFPPPGNICFEGFVTGSGRARAGQWRRVKAQNKTDMNVPTSANPTRRYAARAGVLKSLT